MKQEFDREMDSLLRGALGGSRVAPSRAAGAATAHPSAEELSAFAENVLPPAARSRYVAHIADCDDCRRIVAGVALASGQTAVRDERAAVPEERTTHASAGWGAWLGALLSPRVLRFALPALAVAVLGVISLITLQNRRGGEGAEVAVQSPAESANRASITQPAQPAESSNASVPAEEDSAAGSPGRPQAAADKPTPGDRAAGTTAQAAKEADSAAPPQPAKDDRVADAATAETVTVTTDGMKAAAAPPPASNEPAPAAISSTRVQQREVARLDDAQERKDDAQERKSEDEAAKVEEREGESRNARAGRPGETASAPARNTDSLALRRSKPREEENSAAEFSVRSEKQRGAGGRVAASEGDRRSVAGREFRRRGGEWVDVNYRETMPTTSYKRGSESFRALVADLPEIGRAAEQLQGTVVVVARGRAYRIQ